MSLYVVAGTGSRSLQGADNATKRAALDSVTERLQQRLSDHPDLVVMSGLAEGWDTAVATAALNLGLPLWCAVPNRGYGAWYWGKESLTGRNRLAEFNRVLDRAWRVTYVMEDVHGTRSLKLNGRHANYWRNDFMVLGGLDFPGADDFAVLGPVKPRSGTADCVATIKRAGKWRDDMVLLPQQAALFADTSTPVAR